MTALVFEARAAAPGTPALPRSAERFPPRDYISFSAIRTYQQCPLRYFFRYVARISEERSSASLVFGSAIHRAIELHFQRLLERSSPPTRVELFAAYREGWGDFSLPIRFAKDEKADSFDELARRMLVAFSATDLARPRGRILGVQETLRGEVILALPDVIGRFDLIWETKDELVITDWKTSRARCSQDQIDESAPQLMLYGELARNFAAGKQIHLQFGVPTKTKEVSVEMHSFSFDDQLLHRTKCIVERVWKSITSEHFFPAPSPMNCSGCPCRSPCRKWPG